MQTSTKVAQYDTNYRPVMQPPEKPEHVEELFYVVVFDGQH